MIIEEDTEEPVVAVVEEQPGLEMRRRPAQEVMV